ncbi:MAG: TRAP transporter small permease subunit, partial [Gammaproteobacteria bacterium]|nr:TRAP transporter small permease subunit [Gammaproteobacteria bacterium]
MNSSNITTLFAHLIRSMNGAGVVWVFALMFLICADIAGRTLFDRPLQAVPEIVSLSLIGCVFLQIAFAISMNRLTRAELLLDQIRKRQPALAISLPPLFALAGLVVFGAIAIGAWPDFWRALTTREFVGVEGIYTLPVSPIKFFVVAGCVAAVLTYAGQLVAAARSSSSLSLLLASAIAALIGLCVVLAWNVLPTDRQVGILAIAGVLVLIAAGT